MQGFQFLVDKSGGFAAVAADFIEVVEDDYGRNPRLLFALRSPWTAPAVVNHRELVASSLHDAVSLARLSSLANLLVPVGLPSLASSKFHSVFKNLTKIWAGFFLEVFGLPWIGSCVTPSWLKTSIGSRSSGM